MPSKVSASVSPVSTTDPNSEGYAERYPYADTDSQVIQRHSDTGSCSDASAYSQGKPVAATIIVRSLRQLFLLEIL
jgi:hypothetical protein